MLRIATTAVLLLILAATSFAAHPLITDDAGTMGKRQIAYG